MLSAGAETKIECLLGLKGEIECHLELKPPHIRDLGMATYNLLDFKMRPVNCGENPPVQPPDRRHAVRQRKHDTEVFVHGDLHTQPGTVGPTSSTDGTG